MEERLKERLTTARRALETLKELLSKDSISKVERDAAIQRFEYTFEAVWKAAKTYFKIVEGLDVGSPKGVARASLQVGLLDDTEVRLALQMADDRNLTVHTYNEALAEKIYAHLADYARLIGRWLTAMEARAQSFP